jgi:hypothetical protein
LIVVAAVCAASFYCASSARAQTTSGFVTAWGAGTTNEINGGDLHTEFGQSIIPTAALSGVSAIAGNRGHTIALKGGAVLAWGNNNAGQCTIPASATSGVSAVAGGAYHTIALKGGAGFWLGVPTTTVNAIFLPLPISAFLLLRAAIVTTSLLKMARFLLGVGTTTVNAPFLLLL